MTGKEAGIVALAGQALNEAMRYDWDAAVATVKAIDAEAGAGGVRTALIAWCDTLFVYQRRAGGMPDELGPDEVVRPVWVGGDTGGEFRNAGDVDPVGRWTGRLLAARAAMDYGTFQALLSSVPPRESGTYVGGLLQSVALGMRALKDGAR